MMFSIYESIYIMDINNIIGHHSIKETKDTIILIDKFENFIWSCLSVWQLFGIVNAKFEKLDC